MFNLANKLVVNGLTKRYQYVDDVSIATKGVLSDDIIQASVESLRAKVDKFNVSNRVLARSRTVIQSTSLFVSNNIDATNATKRFNLGDRGNIEEGIIDDNNKELELLRQRNIQVEGDKAKADSLEEEEEIGIGSRRPIDPKSETGQ